MTIFSLSFVLFPEKKRRVYDQYGKDGLLGHNERHHRSRRHEYDDLDFGFVFRSPDEVFREFFGVNSPFSDLFGGSEYRPLHNSVWAVRPIHSQLTNPTPFVFGIFQI